ncbi:hypothetical protein A4H97_10625 [Niastella yeongjuensis]|uniref:Uncharacterized protein n=1 Tax=Niastella yeongjuensis TaxID=354355 RepID=A0A1V9EF99_9BACT|nr:hypothetical protein A4H97_10625 [Niastella yeongjuensis]
MISFFIDCILQLPPFSTGNNRQIMMKLLNLETPLFLPLKPLTVVSFIIVYRCHDNTNLMNRR